MYARAVSEGGVRCIDARANKCVKSWTKAELHDPHIISDDARGANDEHKKGDADESRSKQFDHVPRSSVDGSKLAFASGD